MTVQFYNWLVRITSCNFGIWSPITDDSCSLFDFCLEISEYIGCVAFVDLRRDVIR